MDSRTPQLSLAAARRIALAAQGFGKPRPARPPSVNQIAALVSRLGVLQLDSVNVFARSHYMPVFSRLGPYDRARLDRIAGHGDGTDRPPAGRVLGPRGIADPGRAPSAVPLADGGRRPRGVGLDLDGSRASSPSSSRRRSSSSPSRGRSAPGTPAPSGRRRGPGHMWNWHEGKVALEHLFFTGQVAAARRVNFERLYDTIERVLPAEILERPTPDPADAQRELVRDRRPSARRRHRARHRRLLPAPARGLEGARRGAGRRPAS